MKSVLSKVARVATMAVWLIGSVLHASAQTYPNRPITMYVGLAAGGGTDLLARALAAKMSEKLGQPVVVENLPGGSGTIANQKVATAPKDGYSLLLLNTSGVVLAAVRTDLPYDVRTAFAPVDLISESAYLVAVTPSLPARNLKEFVDTAKAAPGKLNYATPGTGSHTHIVAAAFALAADIDIGHVPYKGSSEAAVAVAAGNADMTLVTPTAAQALIQANKLRALAITTGERSELFPDVPTVQQEGIEDYDFSTWYALLTTAGTPPDVVKTLNQTVEDVIASPELATFFTKNGMVKRGGTSDQLGAYIKSEIERYSKVVQRAGIRLE